ncbi:hypothetical protein BC332_34047 [Capsicum chinense]|nr:hypothetical protein BC332_34047 [Capsicum chinense]
MVLECDLFLISLLPELSLFPHREDTSTRKQVSEIERRFLDTLLFWATQKGRIKDGKLRGHGMQVGDTVSGPREDLSSAEVKKGYEFLLSLVPGRWPLPNLCSPLFQKFIDYILQNVKDLFINKQELDKFVLLKNEFQVLEGSLKYLKTLLDFIKDSGMELEKSRMLFNHVEVVTRNAAYICYLCFVEEVDDNLASGLRRKISNVLLEIKPLERRVSEIYTGALRGLVKLQVQYNRDVIEFVEGFVHFLFQDLSELSNNEACSLMLPLVNDQIKSLYHAATQLVTLLIYPPEDLCVDQGKLSDILNCAEGLIAEVASAAYSFSVEKAEEVNPVFTELLKKIDRVMEDLRDVEEPNPVRQVVETTQLDEVVVGFDEEADLLIDRLTRGPKYLDIVSIVGMPGLGKTTLAKKVYHDVNIRNYFDVQAMCCVSQAYDWRKLLLDILNQVKSSNQQNEKNPADALRKFLIRKRYLLYIDDIWSVDTWDDLRGCFPDDDNGSRILLTSRLSDVASEINPDREPLHLRFLFENESWELMKIKLFKEQTCPPDLSKVGENIARKCRGLRLLVILVAGVLSGISQNEASGEKLQRV